MKSGNKAKLALGRFVTAAAINEIIPQGTPLLDQFQQSASPDESNQATLDTILADARDGRPHRSSYANLFDAIGTMTSDLCSRHIPGGR